MSEDFLGIDLKIDPATRDVVLDPVGEPLLVSGRDCLAQDLRFRLLSDPALLAFIQADILPGDVRELRSLAVVSAETDPRVVPGRSRAAVTKADIEGLEIDLTVLPIGQDTELNLVVRLGGFG